MAASIEPIQSSSAISRNTQNPEFTPEAFDNASKAWRKNKLFLQSKQLFYYKTNTDSPFILEDYKQLGKPKSIYPNALEWCRCSYISATGNRCENQGILDDAKISKNPEYDYEKYNDVYLCQEHIRYLKKEKRKRELAIECAKLERQKILS